MVSSSNLYAQDYFPFGSVMQGRAWNNEKYRFGFNGKEEDTEGMGGGGSTYDYGFRIYNPSLGKFLSVDPLSPNYPWYTPYQFAGNKVIEAIDIDGLEEFLIQNFYLKNSSGKPFLYLIHFKNIPESARIDHTANRVYQFSKTKKFQEKRSIIKIIKTYWSRIIGEKNLKRAKRKGRFKDHNSTMVNKFNQDPNKKGNALAFASPTLYLGNDEGNNEPEMTAAIEANAGMSELVDNVASILINDPAATITITGSASRKPTNIDGTKAETSEANNEILAKKRAEAGAHVLRDILKNNYNKNEEEISTLMQRVTSDHKVQGTSDDSESQQAKQRYIEYKINVNAE